MNLFQKGTFELNGGRKSWLKLECDALCNDDIAALAKCIRRIVGPFSSVHGVPRGGLRLEALLLMVDRSLSSTLLIVDDVLTTGGSMKRMRERLAHAHTHIIGAVVFARGPCPSWIQPVFQEHMELWNE